MTVSHVLLVTIDSLRWDHVLGYRRPTAPNVSELAADGTTFSRAVANGPNTPTSFPSILTSTHASMYGGYDYLDDRRPFVAKTLSEAGFTTVGYHSNPHLGANRNYHFGFDRFNDSAATPGSMATVKDRVEEALDPDSRIYSLLRRLWHHFTLATDSSAYAKAPSITGDALDWLDGEWNGDDRFFMWLHYMDVHYPFAPPERFAEEVGSEPLPRKRIVELNGKMQEAPDSLTDSDVRDLLELYDGEIRFVDHHIGELRDYLSERGALDETAIFVTADHGEAFGEHGRYGHHSIPYDELMRVPLVVYTPGDQQRTVEQQASLVDIGPTTYDLLDVPTPDAVQGRSLVPLLRGETLPERPAICTSMGGGVLASRTEQWKCIWLVEEERVELYDLEDDPGETTDVATEHPDTVDELLEPLRQYREDANATAVTLPDVEESSEVQDRLKQLGYLE